MGEVETAKDFLERLADSNKSTGEDALKMEQILKYIGFKKTRVTSGLVYLEGRGIPYSVNEMAEKILEGLDKATT
ncbi:MAG: hypothetical protein ABEK17_03785 [Candidatus Aenigmatarchaeota archaeon]